MVTCTERGNDQEQGYASIVQEWDLVCSRG
ncbi:unnamed protein product, partial [Allacma fusca]